MEKKRKAQASIIVLVLIVLIVIVAVLIIWNVVTPLVKTKGEEAGIERLTTNLEIKEAILFVTGASKISVSRGAGKGDISSLKFVFYDENGNSNSVEEKTILAELGTEMYSFSPFSNLGKIERVAVVPVLGKNLGMESKSETNKIIEIPSGLVSWWRFDDLSDFVGGNNCQLISGTFDDGSLKGKVNCGNSSSLSFNNEMAISFWVNSTSDGVLIKKGDNYEISLENNYIKFSYNGKFNQTLNEIGQGWNHIVVSVDVGGVSKIYINKGLGISFEGVSLTENNEDLIINSFNGEIDEVMIFDKPLTKVEGLYNNQKK